VWQCWSFTSSWWLFLQGVSSISPRIYFRENIFCFLPLIAILESSRMF
jgi:hypothetical protein